LSVARTSALLARFSLVTHEELKEIHRSARRTAG
jgi:hypothetical protein